MDCAFTVFTMDKKANRYPTAAKGADIRRIREAAGLTPTACATAMGISYPGLWRYETGEENVDKKTALAFCGVIAVHTKKRIETVWLDLTGHPWGQDAAEVGFRTDIPSGEELAEWEEAEYKRKAEVGFKTGLPSGEASAG